MLMSYFLSLLSFCLSKFPSPQVSHQFLTKLRTCSFNLSIELTGNFQRHYYMFHMHLGREYQTSLIFIFHYYVKCLEIPTGEVILSPLHLKEDSSRRKVMLGFHCQHWHKREVCPPNLCKSACL